jgi:hypothetical protein
MTIIVIELPIRLISVEIKTVITTITITITISIAITPACQICRLVKGSEA